jgi:small-conductance mechanosensitive channel
VWSRRENFLALKNEMYQNIKKTFDEQGIEIPFPHISLYAGSASKPFKVAMNENLRSTADVVSKEE